MSGLLKKLSFKDPKDTTVLRVGLACYAGIGYSVILFIERTWGFEFHRRVNVWLEKQELPL